MPVTGVGRLDYSALLTQTVEEVISLSYPEQVVAANQFDDYAELDLNSSVSQYIIGTNANAQRAGSWGSGVLARSIAFFADVDFLVRFNFIDALEHEVPATILKTYAKRAERIFIRAKSRSGKVRVWMEG